MFSFSHHCVCVSPDLNICWLISRSFKLLMLSQPGRKTRIAPSCQKSSSYSRKWHQQTQKNKQTPTMDPSHPDVTQPLSSTAVQQRMTSVSGFHPFVQQGSPLLTDCCAEELLLSLGWDWPPRWLKQPSTHILILVIIGSEHGFLLCFTIWTLYSDDKDLNCAAVSLN